MDSLHQDEQPAFLPHQIIVLLQQGYINQVFLVVLLIDDGRREIIFEDIVKHRWRKIPQETSSRSQHK